MERTLTLTSRQKRFIEFYLQTWNASESARQAGYLGKADVTGAVLLKKPLVAAAIHERMRELQLNTNDILTRLSEQATANYADFFLFETEDGITKIAGVNWDVFRQRGHLVKKLSWSKTGAPVLEFHDAQTALIHIGKAIGVLTERVDVNQKSETVNVLIYLPDNGRSDSD